jgi:hypothetical protein
MGDQVLIRDCERLVQTLGAAKSAFVGDVS